MEHYLSKITEYLPKIEEFLTSILLEETTVTVTDNSMMNVEAEFAGLGEEDIYMYAFDEINLMDVVVVLDKEWFALLSSIMLGVEERSFNDTTKDLLKKFSGELKTTFKKVLAGDGVEVKVGDVEATPHKKIGPKLRHTEYLFVKLEVEGLADENVHASILLGTPESFVQEEPEEELVEDSTDGFRETSGDNLEESHGGDTVTGQYIEFEDFEDQAPLDILSEDGKSMDVLRDVEMEVSVELGRINMPLGRVLQLARGSVIELDKLAGEPVDILVNGQRIAQGEVVVIDEHFGVRISNLITTRQHLVKIN